MHEILLYGLPAAGGAAYGARLWWARHRPRPRRLRFGPLEGTDGKRHAFEEYARAKAVAVVFMTNRCPGVKAYDGRLRRLHNVWGGQVAFVGINPASEALYPSEGLAQMRRAAHERRLPFPYLKDADQRTAKSFGAVCTPEVFVLDPRGRLRYHGRIDDAIVEGEVREQFLADALGRLVSGSRGPRKANRWTAPLGCTIEFA